MDHQLSDINGSVLFTGADRSDYLSVFYKFENRSRFELFDDFFESFLQRWDIPALKESGFALICKILKLQDFFQVGAFGVGDLRLGAGLCCGGFAYDLNESAHLLRILQLVGLDTGTYIDTVWVKGFKRLFDVIRAQASGQKVRSLYTDEPAPVKCLPGTRSGIHQHKIRVGVFNLRNVCNLIDVEGADDGDCLVG